MANASHKNGEHANCGSNPMTAAAKCENCRFFNLFTRGSDRPHVKGWCQRRSPVTGGPNLERAVFVNVEKSDWCGEFEKREDQDGTD